MRVEESFCFIPQRVLLLCAESGDLFYRRGSVFAFPADKDWFQNFFHCICAAFKPCFFPCGIRIEKKQIFGRIVSFVRETDQIGADLSCFFLINAVDCFVSRICDLFDIFGNLDLRNKCSVFVLDGGKFVNASERRAVFRCDQIRADTPAAP